LGGRSVRCPGPAGVDFGYLQHRRIEMVAEKVEAMFSTPRKKLSSPPQHTTRRIAMSRRHLYLICLSLIGSSPATSALADACPAPLAKIQLLSSHSSSRPANFSPWLKIAQASVDCIQECKKEYPCGPGGSCPPKLQEGYLACLNACG
jgi:hypothetical protein